jgi:hypothetical protein
MFLKHLINLAQLSSKLYDIELILCLINTILSNPGQNQSMLYIRSFGVQGRSAHNALGSLASRLHGIDYSPLLRQVRRLTIVICGPANSSGKPPNLSASVEHWLSSKEQSKQKENKHIFVGTEFAGKHRSGACDVGLVLVFTSSVTQHRRILDIVGYSTSSATQHRRLLNIVGYSTSSVTQHRQPCPQSK